jgi:UDP-3-O-[3-hydroxymyristoyl] glucosamine N-acyltransferase
MTPPCLTAQAVADLVGGRLRGDGATPLSSVGPLDRAGPETLSFLVSPKFLPYFRSSSAGAVLITEALADEAAGPATRIIVRDPHQALLKAVPALQPRSAAVAGIDPTARLGEGVALGEAVSIGVGAIVGRRVRLGARTRVGPGAVIEDDVVIGDDCLIGVRVVCHSGTRIGDRVILKAGAVIGGEGFGYASTADGHMRIQHVGSCILEDEVEIGSNTCVDRGSVDDTVIGRGTKIDNLVQIAHNVRIGAHCLIMAGSGIAGSVRIGAGVVVAGAVGIANGVQIGAGARIAAKSGVFGDIPGGETWGGYPARPHRTFLRAQAALHRLAPLASALESLIDEQRTRASQND